METNAQSATDILNSINVPFDKWDWDGDVVELDKDIRREIDNIIKKIPIDVDKISPIPFRVSDIIKCSSVKATKLTWFLLQRGFVKSTHSPGNNSVMNIPYRFLSDRRDRQERKINSREVVLTHLGEVLTSSGSLYNLKIVLIVYKLRTTWLGRLILRIMSNKMTKVIELKNSYSISVDYLKSNKDLL